MTYEIYTIFDSCAKSYNNPFYFLNDNIATRAATDLLKDENEISRHPTDFAMFKIGQFDPQTGEIFIYETRQCLIKFHELAATMPAKAEQDSINETPILKEA